MNPQQLNSDQQPTIEGEPLDLETMLGFADIDIADIESASEWWDRYASPEWRGALDVPPDNG